MLLMYQGGLQGSGQEYQYIVWICPVNQKNCDGKLGGVSIVYTCADFAGAEKIKSC